jgi:hypothetical protein
MLVFVLSGAGGVMLGLGMLIRLGEAMNRGLEESEQRLAYHTDHQQVLDACRWLQVNPKLAHSYAPLRSRTPTGPATTSAPAFYPAVLDTLNPEFINVSDDGVMIFFGGGFGHWWYYAPNREPKQSGPIHGMWQLVPGLWYWNEWGRFPANPATAGRLRTSTKCFVGAGIAVALAIAIPTARHNMRRTRLNLVNDR